MPVNIRGKMYSTVDERLRTFRERFPAHEGWGLSCEVLTIDDDQVTLTARITDPEGRVVGQGHAQEYKSGSRINSTSMLENAETSAWGRALASIGYFGDGNYAVATAEEVQQAIATQEAMAGKPLEAHGLTVADVDRWCDAIGYRSKWGAWSGDVRKRFVTQLVNGDLTPDMISSLTPPNKTKAEQ